MPRKLTTALFKEKACRVHGIGKYDYSETEYASCFKPVAISCLQHGTFWQTPNVHVSGHGCPKCWRSRLAVLRTTPINMFIHKANKVHLDKYDYSNSDYVHCSKKISIGCKIHGIFEQTPTAHLSGHGCRRCASVKTASSISNTFKVFKNRAILIHKHRYSYANSKYLGWDTKIEIKCKTFLLKRNILFESGKKFDSCRGKKYPLPFDFYLPGVKTLIEYDGEQHFRDLGWTTKTRLGDIKRNDLIKTIWAKSNGFKLIRIKYTDFNNIPKILGKRLTYS